MVRKLLLMLAALAYQPAAAAPEPTGPPAMVAGRYVIDVRTRDEWDKGHIEGALLIPHEQITDGILAVLPRRAAPISLYCGSGRRAQTALEALKAMGYLDVENLGGLEDARRKLQPAERPPAGN